MICLSSKIGGALFFIQLPIYDICTILLCTYILLCINEELMANPDFFCRQHCMYMRRKIAISCSRKSEFTEIIFCRAALSPLPLSCKFAPPANHSRQLLIGPLLLLLFDCLTFHMKCWALIIMPEILYFA